DVLDDLRDAVDTSGGDLNPRKAGRADTGTPAVGPSTARTDLRADLRRQGARMLDLGPKDLERRLDFPALLGPREVREDEHRDDRHDADDDHQLEERKTFACVPHGCPEPVFQQTAFHTPDIASPGPKQIFAV